MEYHTDLLPATPSWMGFVCNARDVRLGGACWVGLMIKVEGWMGGDEWRIGRR